MGGNLKSHLLRALQEWCCQSGYTPMMLAAVNEATEVPRAFVDNGQIALNLSPLATRGLAIGDEFIEFQSRFGGVVYRVAIPLGQVLALYARETGEGLAFAASPGTGAMTTMFRQGESADASSSSPPPDPPSPGGSPPHLVRIK